MTVPNEPCEAGRPAAVYRFYDGEGALLYVGLAYDPKQRWRSHARERANNWWLQVARHEVEWFSTRREAAAAEAIAVSTERPLHNIVYTGRNCGGGQTMYEVARQVFGDGPFTQADLYAASNLSKSGVEKNVQALRRQGRLVAVGKRTNARRAGKRHTLYVVFESPIADVGETVIEFVQPDGRISAHVGAVPLPMESPSHVLLARIRAQFGDSEFTKADVVASTGLSRAAVGRQVAFLAAHGHLVQSGVRKNPSRSGYAPSLYTVTNAST